MRCGETVTVCCEIHKQHVNTFCGQNVELLNVVVNIVTTGSQTANSARQKNRLGNFIALFATFKFRKFTLEVTTYSKERCTSACKHSGLCCAKSEQLLGE